jgi:endonuclease YncB( thermonuclease family)
MSSKLFKSAALAVLLLTLSCGQGVTPAAIPATPPRGQAAAATPRPTLPATASVIEGRVVGVSDGDTVTVLDAGRRQHKIRLLGVDAPEKDQDFGERSKQSLSDLVYGKDVTVDYEKKDRYGRTLGKVMVGGRSANLEQVRAGLAWFYRHYADDVPKADRTALDEAEREARQSKRGLWSQPNPTPPWDFRRGGRAAGGGREESGAGEGEGRPGADGRLVPPAGRLIGNRRSMIYHRPDCPSYHQVSPANRVYFDSPADAVRAGYRLARNCP